jgi:hypothetical protein
VFEQDDNVAFVTRACEFVIADLSATRVGRRVSGATMQTVRAVANARVPVQHRAAPSLLCPLSVRRERERGATASYRPGQFATRFAALTVPSPVEKSHPVPVP